MAASIAAYRDFHRDLRSQPAKTKSRLRPRRKKIGSAA
jgi:hypothetical protein